jgi:hypothetical protein
MIYFRQQKENRRGVITFGKWHIANAEGEARCEHPKYRVGDSDVEAKDRLDGKENLDICWTCGSAGVIPRRREAAIPRAVYRKT